LTVDDYNNQVKPQSFGRITVLALSKLSPRVLCRGGQVVAKRVRVCVVMVDNSETSSVDYWTRCRIASSIPLGYKDLEEVNISKSKRAYYRRCTTYIFVSVLLVMGTLGVDRLIIPLGPRCVLLQGELLLLFCRNEVEVSGVALAGVINVVYEIDRRGGGCEERGNDNRELHPEDDCRGVDGVD
jgi:hypothetical protein